MPTYGYNSQHTTISLASVLHSLHTIQTKGINILVNVKFKRKNTKNFGNLASKITQLDGGGEATFASLTIGLALPRNGFLLSVYA
jgi:hypothetical protein